jgi:hypothetical protein
MPLSLSLARESPYEACPSSALGGGARGREGRIGKLNARKEREYRFKSFRRKGGGREGYGEAHIEKRQSGRAEPYLKGSGRTRRT